MNACRSCLLHLLLILFASGIVWERNVCAAESATLFDQRGVYAVIQAPPSPDATSKRAADLIADSVKRISGFDLRILPASATPPRGSGTVVIHLGKTPHVRSQNIGGTLHGPDGFVFHFQDGKNFSIVANTGFGLYNGALEFCESILGVRWLMPGNEGVYWPEDKSCVLEPVHQLSDPAFVSRLFSGLGKGLQQQWGVKMRLRTHIGFHHNLSYLFPPEEYGAIHPEIYPMIDGKRRVPSAGERTGWQPCFSNPKTAEIATQRLLSEFKAKPDTYTYSLGVNDRSGFCECENCAPTGENFLGLRNYSNGYYAWCNAVITAVSRKHPEILFGGLAYSEVAEAPTFPVHNKMVPFMTYERLKWKEPRFLEEGQRQTENWSRAAHRIGWYDYLYGSLYCVPRVYPTHLTETIQFAHRSNVRLFYAEAYPNWVEGPKLYMMAKLLWNPYIDTEALLQDWYVSAVGPRAAPKLQEFYQIWERFWMEKMPGESWFSLSTGQYLPFKSVQYLDAVEEEQIRRSEALLDQIVHLADQPQFKTRAQQIHDLFEYTRASFYARAGRRLVNEVPVRDEVGALRSLTVATNSMHMAAKRLDWLATSASALPGLVAPVPLDRVPELKGDDWNSGLLWPASSWITRSARVRSTYQSLARSDNPTLALSAKCILAMENPQTENLLRNASFEQQTGMPANWKPWKRGGVGLLKSFQGGALDGSNGVTLFGIARGGFYQEIEVPAGVYAGDFWCRSPLPTENSSVSLLLIAYDKDDQQIAQSTSTRRIAQGVWNRVGGELKVSGANGPYRLRYCVITHGMAASEAVFADKSRLHRIP